MYQRTSELDRGFIGDSRAQNFNDYILENTILCKKFLIGSYWFFKDIDECYFTFESSRALLDSRFVNARTTKMIEMINF